MIKILRYIWKFCLYLTMLSYPLAPSLGAYLVYGVRSEFPMTEGQKLYRDIYVNLGTAQGVKVGSKLEVYRTLSTADQLNQKNGPNINFPIAHLKIIHVEDTVAVARILDFLPKEDAPFTEFSDIMVGDRVEVSHK